MNKSTISLVGISLAAGAVAFTTLGSSGSEPIPEHPQGPGAPAASAVAAAAPAIPAPVVPRPGTLDGLGLPATTFLGDTTSPDGRRIGAASQANLKKWENANGSLNATALPDVIECVGDGGLPLRVTKATFLAVFSNGRPFNGGVRCDGTSPAGGITVLSSGATKGKADSTQVYVGGQLAQVAPDGTILDSHGNSLGLPYHVRNGKLVGSD